ncbi:PREDICTED: putative glutathione peroxidase 7, chloroplastic [Camelina sativa]|uniref:Glutathione peroxidase 7, chloroplastic n=1 Tax=Camelina sativa TaxID=90675 RepID=A0ABM1QKL7_CAMSA|nr:PREDICTED: putative glutathione peroxidase 7, chloroplastic [Camelina sativa]
MASSYASFLSISNGFVACPPPNSSVFLVPSLKLTATTSYSRNLRNGVSLKSSNNHGFLVKSRNFPSVYARAAAEKSVHDFTVKDIDGKDVSLDKFKGKPLLIVNVASRCGLTSSNYSELSHLYEKYKNQGKLFTVKVFYICYPHLPIYKFLKSSAGGFLGDIIKWNFEKFLVDKKGKVVERYPPTTSPFQIEKDIKKLLAA